MPQVVAECALDRVSSQAITDFAENIPPEVCGSPFRLGNSPCPGSSRRNGESADSSGTSETAEIDTRNGSPAISFLSAPTERDNQSNSPLKLVGGELFANRSTLPIQNAPGIALSLVAPQCGQISSGQTAPCAVITGLESTRTPSRSLTKSGHDRLELTASARIWARLPGCCPHRPDHWQHHPLSTG